jgi:hypothetical protein
VLNAIHDFIMLNEQNIVFFCFKLKGGGDCNGNARNVITTSVVNAMFRSEF